MRRLRLAAILVAAVTLACAGGSAFAQAAAPAAKEGKTAELLKSAHNLFTRNQMDAARPLFVVVLQREESGTDIWRQASNKLALSFFVPGGVNVEEYRKWAETKYSDPRVRGLVILALADYFWQGGDDDRALVELGSLPDEKSSAGLAARILKAECLAGKGQQLEAIALLEAVAGEGADDALTAHALCVAGNIRLGMGMADPARADFERIIAAFPASAWVDSARESLDRIASMKTGSAAARVPIKGGRMRVPAPAATDQTRAIWAKIIADGVKRGDELLAAGKVDEAREAYGRLLSLSGPTHLSASAADKIVQSFVKEGALATDECRQWSQTHLTSEAQKPRIEVAIARSHYRSQDYDGALGLLTPLNEPASPVRLEAGELTGLCLVAKGERERAVEILTSVADEATDDDEAGARSLLVLGWLHLQNQEYGPAKSVLDDMVRRYPESPLVRKAEEISARLAGLEGKK